MISNSCEEKINTTLSITLLAVTSAHFPGPATFMKQCQSNFANVHKHVQTAANDVGQTNENDFAFKVHNDFHSDSTVYF